MIMEPEARRCRKTDGKKWRCSKEVLPEQKYCERHIHRRRKYTRKHYSEASIDSINVTVTTTNLSKSLPNPPLQTATISSLVDNVKKNANVNDMDKKESGNDSSLIAIGQNFSSDCNSSRSKFNLETMNKGVKSSANVAALVIGFPSRRNLHEEHGSESKRVKGIGIGAPEGPISLDDFRSLQRSNTELWKQLESQVITIDLLRNENSAGMERHEREMNDLKSTVSNAFMDKLKKLQNSVDIKQKESSEIQKTLSEQKHMMEDFDKKLESSMQSCSEAKETIKSQRATISELKAQLYEEREQRREERDKACADLEESIQRVQAEAQVEITRVSEAFSRREKDPQELIIKLQESDKERCLMVETFWSKLDDTRDKLVISENKVRQLAAQLSEEQEVSINAKNRIEELEQEIKRSIQELKNEKLTREEAWAKVSTLELKITTAAKDLYFERRRLKEARERIMLRETQLRAFYSTTEEISVLFTRQQEQLKTMQRTLEDEDNYGNTFLDIDLSNREVLNTGNESNEEGVSATEKQDTQEAEFAGNKEGFGSDIETETERVHETENQAGNQMTNPVSDEEDMELAVGIVNTADLLASEAVGSWAYSTNDEMLVIDSHESQTTPVSEIKGPDLEGEFVGPLMNDNGKYGEDEDDGKVADSNSDTEDYTDDEEDNDGVESAMGEEEN